MKVITSWILMTFYWLYLSYIYQANHSLEKIPFHLFTVYNVSVYGFDSRDIPFSILIIVINCYAYEGNIFE